MGTERGLIRNRDPSGSSRMESEWGLSGDSDPSRSSRQPEDVTAIHCLAASRLRGRRLPRHRPPAREPKEIRGKAGATVYGSSRTGDQDGPEPGHLMRRLARSERRPEERSDGERTGTERRRGPR
jgi:hypothetical protein